MSDPLRRCRSAGRRALLALLLGVSAIALSGASFADELEADEVRALRERGAILPLEDILERVRAARPGRVIEIELEHEGDAFVYELEMLDADGGVREVRVDAVTGEILGRDHED